MYLVSTFSADFGMDPRSQDSIITKRSSVPLILLFTHPSLKKDEEDALSAYLCNCLLPGEGFSCPGEILKQQDNEGEMSQTELRVDGI